MDISIETVFQYGLPTVLLTVLVLGFWRGGNKIALWIKPIIERVTNDHLELVSTLKTNSSETKDALGAIKTHMESHTSHLSKQTEILQGVSENIKSCPPVLPK